MQDRLQFSLRSLLLATALVAISLGVFLLPPSAASVFARLIVGFLLMSLAIIAVFVTTGIARAFWIGVAAPLAMSMYTLSQLAYQAVAMWFGQWWSWAGQQHTGVQTQSCYESVAKSLNFSVPIFFFAALVNGTFTALVFLMFRPSPRATPRHHSIRISTLLWIALAVATFFGGLAWTRRSTATTSPTWLV
jgi:hypothetical protein